MTEAWKLLLIGVIAFVFFAESSYYLLQVMTNLGQAKLLKWQTTISLVMTFLLLGSVYFYN